MKQARSKTGPERIFERMEGFSGDAKHARFIRESGLAAQFAQLSEPVLHDLGFRLIKVALSGSDNTTVQIMVERPDGSISVKECADISRALSPLFDAHDPISGSYFLEVSSPGIDRPLVRPSDFDDWAGHRAKIELKELLEGRKRFKGVLEGFEDGEIRIEVELDQIGSTVLGLPLSMVAEARLVLTEKLIREALAKQKSSQKAQNDDQQSDDQEGHAHEGDNKKNNDRARADQQDTVGLHDGASNDSAQNDNEQTDDAPDDNGQSGSEQDSNRGAK